MQVSELKSKIKSNTIPNLLIFTGEEIQVARIYRNKIATILNLPLIYCDTVQDVYKKLTNNSFITNNACYVVLEDKDIITNEKGLLAVIEKLKDNHLILQYDKIDKRSKFYKQHEVYEFEKLEPGTLIKYVQQEINLNMNNCRRLIDICENDYCRILLEIDKIKQYGGNCDSTFLKLIEDGTIYIPPYDAIFDFVDAVLRKQKERAFELLQVSYDVGENTLTLLSGLYINTKHVIQVQFCESNDIAKNTGLTPWQVKCTLEKTGYYTLEELLKLLKLIGETERGIKLGTIDDSVAISSLLLNIF